MYKDQSNGRVTAWMVGIAVVMLATAVSEGVSAATIVPVSQQRGTNAFVIVPPCESGTIAQDDDASNFRPFDSSVTAERICDLAQGTATASQQSEINPSSLIATGATFSQAISGVNTVIHAISSSTYDVDFTVPFPSRFTITGVLTASGHAPVVLSSAMARLTASGNVQVFSHQVEPGPNGAPNSLTIQQSGMLAPGTYTLFVWAGTVIDSQVPPMGSGDASFDATFEVSLLGDVNGDEIVDVTDLLAVINAWGQCPAPSAICAADVTGDGVVDVADLLLVINNWT